MLKIFILMVTVLGFHSLANTQTLNEPNNSTQDDFNCFYESYEEAGVGNTSSGPLLYNFFNIWGAPPMCFRSCDIEYCCSITIVRRPDIEIDN